MAKKKETEPKAMLKDLSATELETRLREVQEHNFRLQFRHASNPLKNPMEIRQNRREIARLKTFLHQKSRGTV
jgi:large subunit ribosomal protein L29